MADYLNKIKQQIVKRINEALGEEFIQASDLIYPIKKEFGDLSLPCFGLAKKLKKAPAESAEWIVENVKGKGVAAGLTAIGPYVNFVLDRAGLAEDVLKQIGKRGREYGAGNKGKRKRVMVEYSNANTHKQYHIGHLRNICYGDAVCRILAANGYKIIPVSYVNDFGIQAAKTIWAYLEFYRGKRFSDKFTLADKGRFLGEAYARAVRELTKNPAAKERVMVLLKKIKSRKGVEYRLWQKTRKWSIEQFAKIYRELGVKFDHIFYESEFVEKGLNMVAELYKKRFLTKSEGAVIADLRRYNLGVLLFLRSDGTALYPVGDLPLAAEKLKKYKLNQSIYVVDARQSLYFRQLFKVLELLGYKNEMIHLSYEFVKLPSGMMQSRTGAVVTYEYLREQVLRRAWQETGQRHKNWSKKKIAAAAEAIANGALKFEMLKVGADQIITFDINQALRFDGFTAAYLQYTCARIGSIIKKYHTNTVLAGNGAKDGRSLKEERQLTSLLRVKGGREKKLADGFWRNIFLRIKSNVLSGDREYQLVLAIAKYPETVIRAGEKYEPAEIAKYLFSLAQIFNDYYHTVPVLRAEAEMRRARLILAAAVRRVLANGLNLLGIEAMEEM